MAQLYQQPTNNNLQYTLNTQLAQGGSSLVLSSSVAGIVQAPGVLVVDRVDASGNKTPSVREYISFTGVSTNTLTGLTKGLGGSTDQVHNVGAIVEFVPDVVWANGIYNVITQEHSTMGQHTCLASTSFISTKSLSVLSNASIRTGQLIELTVASMASLQGATIQDLFTNRISLASINQLYVTNLITASGASIQGIFPSGASGSVLISNGTLPPVFGSSSNSVAGAQRVRVYRTTNQTIGNNSETALQFDNETYDTDTMHDNVTNNSRITFTTAGVYQVNASAVFTGSTTNRRYSYIKLNGTTVIGQFEGYPGASGSTLQHALSYSFTAGQYIEFIVFQNTGGNLDILGTQPCYFDAYRVA